MALVTITYLFLIGFAFFLVWWAHEAGRDRSAMVGLYLILGAPGFLLFIAGLAISTRRGFDDWGPVLLFGGLGLLLGLVPQARALLARVGDFSPFDPVHILGTGIFFGALGFVGGQLATSPEPAEVAAYDTWSIVAQGLFLAGLALVAVGYRIDRAWPAVVERLGLVRPSFNGLTASAVAVVLGFAVSVTGSALTRATNEQYAEEINRSLEVLTTSSPSYIAAPAIGLAAGIGEELLFRGVIQPRYGIVPTSLLFALVHSQYGVTFVTLATFGLGCILGVVAKRYGTTHAIAAHATYNTLAVILSTLAD